MQRPLWASTSTKNPKYPDTMYVDELIGPDTVNTLPLATLRAFADHGTAKRTIDWDVDGARRVVAEIEAAGVSLKDVTDFLVVDGVKKFSDSYHALLATLEAKRDRLLAERPVRASRRLQAFDAEIDALLARDGARCVRGLLAREPGLWSQDEAARREIAQRLGWLDLPAGMASKVAELQAFAEQVRGAGFTRVVLLGMGGSSLAPETFAKVFGPRAGWPTLAVLDSTDPAYIAAVERRRAAGQDASSWCRASRARRSRRATCSSTSGSGPAARAARSSPRSRTPALRSPRWRRSGSCGGSSRTRPTSAGATARCRTSDWCRPRSSAWT